MTRLACAEWRPISTNYDHGGVVRPARGMVVHTAVTPPTVEALDGVWSYFNSPSVQVSSYFIVGIDGHIVQCVDLDNKAWTQAAGNADWIGVEHIGDGTKAPMPDVQVAASGVLLAELHHLYGFALQLTNDPQGEGLGWHGMGAPAWGHAICPGAFVRAQLPAILAAAQGTPSPAIGGSTMARMVAHSNGGDALVTLNSSGSVLIAQGCTPFDPHDPHVKSVGASQQFTPSSPIDEIVATVDGHGILCRFHDGHFDVAKVVAGEVR